MDDQQDTQLNMCDRQGHTELFPWLSFESGYHRTQFSMEIVSICKIKRESFGFWSKLLTISVKRFDFQENIQLDLRSNSSWITAASRQNEVVEWVDLEVHETVHKVLEENKFKF